MSKTPKRKSGKDNESVTSETASVAKRARNNQDAQLIAIFEGERELRSVTKTYTISKYSSRRSVNSDTSDFLNADSDDIADRLQQHSKRVSTPSVKTRNASSSSSAAAASAAAPAVRRGRSKKDSIVNTEPSKRPDGYWSTQPTTTSSSSSEEYPLNAANLSAQQALQRDWSEEASGRIIRGASSTAARPNTNSVSSTPTTRRSSQRVAASTENSNTKASSATPIVSVGQQWIAPIAEELDENDADEDEPTAAAAVEEESSFSPVISASANVTDTGSKSTSNNGQSSFALLILILLVVGNFVLNRKSVISPDVKVIEAPLVRPRADRNTLLEDHLRVVQGELARMTVSNGSEHNNAKWTEISNSLSSVENGLSSAESSLESTGLNLSKDKLFLAEEAARREAAASAVRAASEQLSAAREVAQAQLSKVPHKYSLCDPLLGEACLTFTNSNTSQLVAQMQRIVEDKAKQIADTQLEIDQEWAAVEADLKEVVSAAHVEASSAGEVPSVDLLTIHISDAVEGLTRSHSDLDKHETHIADSVGPALTASIKAKAEAAAAAATAAKALEMNELNRVSLAKRNHLLDHLVKQNVAAVFSEVKSKLAEEEGVEGDEEDEEEEEEEQQTVSATSPAPAGKRGEGVVDYAVAPRGGVILNQDRLTSHHWCRSCSTQPAAESVIESSSPLLKAAQSLGRAVGRALQSPEHRLASAAARRSLLSHSSPHLDDPVYTFSGTKGRVTVRLYAPVNVTQLSIVHVVGTSAELMAAAPREVRFSGYSSDPLTAQQSVDLGILKVIAPTKATAAGALYTRSLDIDKSRSIPPLVAVTAEVLNNYGNREFTLLYRVKVMGELAEEDEGL